MADQIVRLAYSYADNHKCSFSFDKHGSGKITAASDLSPSLSNGLWKLDTGIKFILVSSKADTKAQGFYFIASPSVNYSLEANTVPPSVKIVTPFNQVVGYTSDSKSDPYNLDNIKNKPTLKLAFFPRADSGLTATHVFTEGSVLCYLNFQVVFDLIEKTSCYKLS